MSSYSGLHPNQVDPYALTDIERKLSELGSAAFKDAQTSDTDNTEESTLVVGAGGILGSKGVSIPDIDAPGVLMFFDILAGIKQNPFGNDGAVGLHLPQGPTKGAQILTATSGKGLRIKARSRISSRVWGPLEDLFHTGNVVGDVSQSKGRTTGALFEHGSNANGHYIRFADGTQICYSSVETSVEGSVDVTFPCSFLDKEPRVIFTPFQSNGDARIAVLTGIQFNYFSVVTKSLMNESQHASGYYIAIGRWC